MGVIWATEEAAMTATQNLEEEEAPWEFTEAPNTEVLPTGAAPPVKTGGWPSPE